MRRIRLRFCVAVEALQGKVEGQLNGGLMTIKALKMEADGRWWWVHCPLFPSER